MSKPCFLLDFTLQALLSGTTLRRDPSSKEDRRGVCEDTSELVFGRHGTARDGLRVTGTAAPRVHDRRDGGASVLTDILRHLRS